MTTIYKILSIAYLFLLSSCSMSLYNKNGEGVSQSQILNVTVLELNENSEAYYAKRIRVTGYMIDNGEYFKLLDPVPRNNINSNKISCWNTNIKKPGYEKLNKPLHFSGKPYVKKLLKIADRIGRGYLITIEGTFYDYSDLISEEPPIIIHGIKRSDYQPETFAYDGVGPLRDIRIVKIFEKTCG